MTLMIWGPMFEVGVHQIDAQHRKLFDLANNLSDAITYPEKFRFFPPPGYFFRR